MKLNDPACQKRYKSEQEWSRYIKGASAMFALHVGKSEVITVLARPPPARTNPNGQSTYQEIEEPILKGLGSTHHAASIVMVHFTVVGAEDARYEVWPRDDVALWSLSHTSARPIQLHKTVASPELQMRCF